MASLDLGTVLVLHGTSLLAGATTLLLVRPRIENPSGLGTIAAAFILLAGGALMAGLCEIDAMPSTAWRGANIALGIGAYTLFFLGMRSLDGEAGPFRWLMVIPAAVLVLGLTTPVFADNAMRAVLFHAAAASANLAAGVSILAGHRVEPLPARMPLLAALLACGLVYGAQVPLLVIGLATPISISVGLGLTMMLNFAIAALLVSFVRERREEAHRRASDLDVLTGVLNRRGFYAAVPDHIPAHAALAVFDLDHFKAINDRFGHAAGDSALQRFARLMTEHTRPGEVVARIGGEEFIVYIPEVRSGHAARIAERIRAATLAIDLHCDGNPVALTTSVGLALSSAGEGASRDALLARADAALYAAKAAGRNRVMIASAEEPVRDRTIGSRPSSTLQVPLGAAATSACDS